MAAGTVDFQRGLYVESGMLVGSVEVRIRPRLAHVRRALLVSH